MKPMKITLKPSYRERIQHLLCRYFVPVVLLIVMLAPMSSFATMPVIDYAQITQTVHSIAQLKRQYDLIHQAYQTAQDQLAKANRIMKDGEGHYSFGALKNSAEDLAKRKWSPSTWQDALKGVAGGNPERYQALVKQYQQNHKMMDKKQFSQGASAARTSVYQQDVASNQAASVNTTYAFNNIQAHLNTLHDLSEKIDQAPNSKAASDLNSRILVEVGYIQAQELKMQVMTNQQMARSHADELATQNQSAKFNSLPTQDTP